MTSLSVHYKKYAFLFVLYWIIIHWDRGKYQPRLPTPRWLIVLEYTTRTQDGKKAKTYFICDSYLNNDRYLETLVGKLYLCNQLRASCSQSARAKALKYPLCGMIKYISIYIFVFFKVNDMNRCWAYLPNRKSFTVKTLSNLVKFGKDWRHFWIFPLFLSSMNIQVKIHTHIYILIIKNEIIFKVQCINETSFKTFLVNTR